MWGPPRRSPSQVIDALKLLVLDAILSVWRTNCLSYSPTRFIRDLPLAGLRVDLAVSSSAVAAPFVVRLIDLQPQMLFGVSNSSRRCRSSHGLTITRVFCPVPTPEEF